MTREFRSPMGRTSVIVRSYDGQEPNAEVQISQWPISLDELRSLRDSMSDAINHMERERPAIVDGVPSLFAYAVLCDIRKWETPLPEFFTAVALCLTKDDAPTLTRVLNALLAAGWIVLVDSHYKCTPAGFAVKDPLKETSC